MKNKRKTIKTASFVSATLLLISSLAVLYKLFVLNMLPIKYIIPLVVIILLIDLTLSFLLYNKRVKIKIKSISSVIVLVLLIINIIIYLYVSRTWRFIDALMSKGYKTESYSIMVLSNSTIETIENLDSKSVSYVKNLGSGYLAINELKNKVNIVSNGVSDVNDLISVLQSGNTSAILLEDTYISILEEIYDDEGKDFDSIFKKIDTIRVRIEEDISKSDVNITKDPFIIYVSGIDAYGDISTVSRSDVNIVISINPITKQILLISIPRDYYVKLHGVETNLRDKITHTGMYGIEKSVSTVEDLLDINIDYYLKVNFTSLVDIIDALGEIEVNSKYAFNTYMGYSFKEGINYMNGTEALYFCRERKNFSGGDRARGQNQQAVIIGIIKKISNPSIIVKYVDLIKTLEGKFQSNMDTNNISKFVRMQLNDGASWNIKSINLNGSDSENYTYSAVQSIGYKLDYVMEPDISTIQRAQVLIKAVEDGKILDKTDETIDYDVNNWHK